VSFSFDHHRIFLSFLGASLCFFTYEFGLSVNFVNSVTLLIYRFCLKGLGLSWSFYRSGSYRCNGYIAGVSCCGFLRKIDELG
jgi:hypothetical protein